MHKKWVENIERNGVDVQGIGQRVTMVCTYDAGLGVGLSAIEIALLPPRFSGLGYVFGVLHDNGSIENLEDKVKEKAGKPLDGGMRRKKNVFTELDCTTKV